jgi:CRP/FNR family transcriptional regulator
VAEAIHAALLKVQLFAGSAPQELEYIARRAVSRHFDAAEMIFSEGDPCDGLFVIRSGSVRLFKTSAGGREQTLAIEGAGSSIAELPVFDGGAYPASAAATTDSELIFIARKDFQSLCLEYPQFALRVVRQVGARLRRLVGIIEELSFTTVRDRLIAHLLRLAKTEGRKTARGIEIEVAGSQQDLAASLGTVRELVSRNLTRLAAEGLIIHEGKVIVMPSLAKLEAEQRSAG